MTRMENSTAFQRQNLAEPSARAKRSELHYWHTAGLVFILICAALAAVAVGAVVGGMR